MFFGTTPNMKRLLQHAAVLALTLTVGCGQKGADAPPTNKPEASAAKAAPEASAKVDGMEADVIAAAWEGEIAVVQKAVEGGVDVNAKDPAGGSSLLNLAAIRGRKDLVAYLIEKGADLESKNNEGNTALYNAAFFCHPEVLKLLIEKGANVNVTDKQGAKAIDVAKAEWSPELEGIYKFIDGVLKMDLDMAHIKSTRGTIAEILAGAKPPTK